MHNEGNDMDQKLLDKLKKITKEEQDILLGNKTIQSELYTSSKSSSQTATASALKNSLKQKGKQTIVSYDFTIDSKKLLEKGKLIEVRPHTRFVHFPKHRHNYVELVYMCSGSTTHILNGTDKICLKEGDLLLLNQNATQEILPASQDDIAVNFIILPEFFDRSISMIEQENVLRDFLLHALSGHTSHYSYLHFSTTGILPVQNLLENMIWTIFSNKKNTNTINQTTMGLLLMNLSMFVEKINRQLPSQYEQTQVFTVLQYIETHYKNGTLEDISTQIKQPTYYVSRLLKKHMNKNFKELLQERKLQQATYLLSQSSLTIEQIMEAIGYENSSYFYNRFKEKYHCSPKEYRKKQG